MSPPVQLDVADPAREQLVTWAAPAVFTRWISSRLFHDGQVRGKGRVDIARAICLKTREGLRFLVTEATSPFHQVAGPPGPLGTSMRLGSARALITRHLALFRQRPGVQAAGARREDGSRRR